MMTRAPIRILFLCTGNSCRSQMAEGWARHRHAGVLEAHSAGTEPQGLNPLAVRAMREAGVDITGGTSKRIEDLGDVSIDVVITVCDAAAEACPALPGDVPVVQVPFEDPPKLAATARDEEEAMTHYRRVRDEIRAFIERLPDWLERRGLSVIRD
jgi:arsenate reductase